MIAMDAACKTALQGNIHRSPPFSEVCEDPTESEQSEVAWEGPLGGSSRAWFRGVVDTALVLLRRLQAAADRRKRETQPPPRDGECTRFHHLGEHSRPRGETPLG